MMSYNKSYSVLQSQAVGECYCGRMWLFSNVLVYTDTLGVLARTIGTENFAPISNESVALALVG